MYTLSTFMKVLGSLEQSIDRLYVESRGHGNKFEPISSNLIFGWTKFEFSKNRNKFESRCSNFELSLKRASDISPFHLVPRGPLGPLMFPSC